MDLYITSNKYCWVYLDRIWDINVERFSIRYVSWAMNHLYISLGVTLLSNKRGLFSGEFYRTREIRIIESFELERVSDQRKTTIFHIYFFELPVTWYSASNTDLKFVVEVLMSWTLSTWSSSETTLNIILWLLIVQSE